MPTAFTVQSTPQPNRSGRPLRAAAAVGRYRTPLRPNIGPPKRTSAGGRRSASASVPSLPPFARALRSLPSLPSPNLTIASAIRWVARFAYSIGLVGLLAVAVLIVLACTGGRCPRPTLARDVPPSSAWRYCPWIDYPTWRELVLPRLRLDR